MKYATLDSQDPKPTLHSADTEQQETRPHFASMLHLFLHHHRHPAYFHRIHKLKFSHGKFASRHHHKTTTTLAPPSTPSLCFHVRDQGHITRTPLRPQRLSHLPSSWPCSSSSSPHCPNTCRCSSTSSPCGSCAASTARRDPRHRRNRGNDRSRYTRGPL